MTDIVTSKVQTFYEEKNLLGGVDQDMALNAGRDKTLLTYRDVVCESMQRQSEHLSVLLEKAKPLFCFTHFFTKLLYWGNPTK